MTKEFGTVGDNCIKTNVLHIYLLHGETAMGSVVEGLGITASGPCFRSYLLLSGTLTLLASWATTTKMCFSFSD